MIEFIEIMRQAVHRFDQFDQYGRPSKLILLNPLAKGAIYAKVP